MIKKNQIYLQNTWKTPFTPYAERVPDVNIVPNLKSNFSVRRNQTNYTKRAYHEIKKNLNALGYNLIIGQIFKNLGKVITPIHQRHHTKVYPDTLEDSRNIMICKPGKNPMLQKTKQII